MAFVLVLVSSSIPLAIGHLAITEETLAEQKISRMGPPMWIESNKAAQMVIANKPNPEQIKELRGKLNQYRIDIFIVAPENRRKKLLVADMDSTVITSETLDEIAVKAGIADQVIPITERAMRGELDFEQALYERVALLKDQPESLLHDVLKETKLSAGIETLTATMHSADYHCVLLTGGFTFFASVIAARAGFNHFHGNELEIKDHVLTGKVIPPILDKDAKLSFMRQYMAQYDLTADDVLAIGDGANDLPMLLEAGFGVGYKPKPLLLETLDNCIIYGDLTSLLYVQGYRAA
jgi:phosphoserine phosphatase